MALTSCGTREPQLIPLLVPEDNILPGVEKWLPTTCLLCPAGCGILVRLMQGEVRLIREGKERRQQALQVKKVEGNPAHPVNLGRTCALGQSVPQIIYNPDRLRTPLKRIGFRGSGQFEPISWAEAEELLDASLGLERPSPGLAVLTASRSPGRLDLLKLLLEASGSSRLYVDCPPGFETLRSVNKMIFSRRELETHDLETAGFVLSFGADFLEVHTSPVRYNRGLAVFRRGRPGRRGRYIHAGSRFSLSAANADAWLPVKPGAEGNLALALAHVLLKEGMYDGAYAASAITGFEQFRNWILARYSPAQQAVAIDLPAERIVSLALEFWKNRPAIAIAGGSALAHPHGQFAAAAVQALNAVTGAYGTSGGIGFAPDRGAVENADSFSPALSLDQLLADLNSVETLLIWEANPVYSTPAAGGLRKALEKVPRVVVFSDSMNESALYADLVLPDLTFLERWDLAEPALSLRTRVVSIVQPLIRPMYEGRDCGSVLLQAAARAGGKVAEALPDSDFKAFLIRRLGAYGLLKHGKSVREDADSFMSGLTETGVWQGEMPGKTAVSIDLSRIVELEPPVFPALDAEELYLQPFFTGRLQGGESANQSWMQELPDPMSSVVWGSWMEIHPGTAGRLGIRDGEWAIVESVHGRIKVPALLTPAARPDTVSIPFGQGHRNFGRYASGRGINVNEILQPAQVQGSGEMAWAATRVRVTRTGQMSGMIRLGFDH